MALDYVESGFSCFTLRIVEFRVQSVSLVKFGLLVAQAWDSRP